MKIRTIVAATSAALFSLGAIAAGDDKQKQSQGASPDKSAQTQSSGAASGSTSAPAATEKSSGASASGSTAGQQSTKKSSSAASGSTSAQASQKQASGQSSDLVKQAQQKLSQAGHDVGKPDGIMGPKTQAGLKEFQEKKGLQASGQLDKQTLAALGVSGEVTTGSAATGGSTSGQSQSSSSSPSPAAPAASGSSSGQSTEKKQ